MDLESVRTKRCGMEGKTLHRMKSADRSAWLIDNSALDILCNDPQELIQCTSPGDRLIFKLTGSQKFQQTMRVIHELELMSESAETMETGAFFTCPSTGPFLIVKYVDLHPL